MATGTTKYGNDLLRVPAMHKDGRALSIAFTVAMLFTPDSKVDAVVAIIRDETARFNEERALRKRARRARSRSWPRSRHDSARLHQILLTPAETDP